MRQRKKTRWIKHILTLAFSFFFVYGAEGLDQWTQWRGPNRDGIVNTLPATWPKDLTKKWEIQIGAGHSTPVVWNDTAFTFSREGEEEVVHAIDLGTGKVLWRSHYPAPYSVYPGAAGHGAGPRSTPVFSRDTLFTLGISGIFLHLMHTRAS